MTILLLGSGGREHALAWKMLQSSKCTSLFVAPGNAGTATIAKNVDLNPNNFDAVKAFVLQNFLSLLNLDFLFLLSIIHLLDSEIF